MTARWARFARGWTTAGFATFAAATRLVVRRVLVASTLPVRTRTAHRAPVPTLVVLPRNLLVFLSVMRHRGPPATLRFA